MRKILLPVTTIFIANTILQAAEIEEFNKPPRPAYGIPRPSDEEPRRSSLLKLLSPHRVAKASGYATSPLADLTNLAGALRRLKASSPKIKSILDSTELFKALSPRRPSQSQRGSISLPATPQKATSKRNLFGAPTTTELDEESTQASVASANTADMTDEEFMHFLGWPIHKKVQATAEELARSEITEYITQSIMSRSSNASDAYFAELLNSYAHSYVFTKSFRLNAQQIQELETSEQDLQDIFDRAMTDYTKSIADLCFEHELTVNEGVLGGLESVLAHSSQKERFNILYQISKLEIDKTRDDINWAYLVEQLLFVLEDRRYDCVDSFNNADGIMYQLYLNLQEQENFAQGYSNPVKENQIANFLRDFYAADLYEEFSAYVSTFQ